MSKQNFSHTIWMGDLDVYMTEDFVKQAFASMGESVVSVKIIRSKATMQPLGYCFVEFHDIDEGRNSMLKLNGKEIPGSNPPRRFKLNHASYGKEHLNVQEFSMFVGELSEDVDDLALFNAFKRYPSCRSAKVVLDNGRSRGYGFVRFTDEKEHKRAMTEMQNYPHLGRKPIRVSLAAPKRADQQSSGAPPPHYGSGAGSSAYPPPPPPPPPPPHMLAGMDVPPLPTDPAYGYYQQAYASYLPQYGPYYAHQWACYYAHMYSSQQHTQLPPPHQAYGTTSHQQYQQHHHHPMMSPGQAPPMPPSAPHQPQPPDPTPEELEAAYLSEPVDPEAASAADLDAMLQNGEAAYFDLECSRWSIFDPSLPRIVNAA